jgi:hypothetical protein
MLSGQIDLGTQVGNKPSESVALPNTTDVASFTDTNLADTASSFTATIDWGDQTTTSGTVVGSNGQFTVEGGHTYADEGSPTATVTVTPTAGGNPLVLLGTVSVADTDSFFNLQGKTITFTPNQPLTNVTVGTFSDSNTSNAASDFTVQIDWGDGTTTQGTVTGSAGSFTVQGSHTYTAAGENAISISMADDFPDSATGAITSTAVSGFGGNVTLNAATEGTALNNVEVATFADTSGSLPSTDYTAQIKWGDGTTSTGTVSGANGGPFTVTGSHTYADEESSEVLVNGEPAPSPVMTVDITRTTDNATIAPFGTVAVADADVLTMTKKTLGSAVNQPLTNVTVATFTDTYTGNVASDLVANIEWGDGSTVDVGTVSGSSGAFTVTGSHTYAADGQYNINVSILDDVPTQGQIGAVISTAVVGLAPGQVVLVATNEGVVLPNSTPIATFNDGNSGDTAAGFSNVTIDWGDGATTPGTVTGSNGSFTVTGGHTYADEGSEPVAVAVTRTADQDTTTVTGTVTVGERDSFAVTADNFSGNPGVAISNVQVATFTDTFAGQVAGDLLATINWGDGSSSAGTISGGAGSFTVDGSHTYSTGGNYTFNVSVADDVPGTATANANGTATINFVGQMVLTAATEGTALPGTTPVATFSDSNGGDTAGSFSASINWGDGTTTTGTVTGGAGSFTVDGGHTYADEGSDTASVTLTHTADLSTSTVSGAVSVAEADVLTPHGMSIAANAHQLFSGAVATFTDGNTANVASDFTATVDWGDGTTTAGTVSGSGGSFTVSGAHTYTAAGNDTVKVKLTDDAPGTATATATTAATVSRGSAVAYDFNGDGKSDLLFQNTNATPQIWLMNGTSVVSMTSLAQPPSGWKIVTAADFNGDGDADILWINTASNQPAIWEMNGTSIVSAVGLPAPPPSWRIAGAGDLFGSGDAAIIWQNSDGTPSVWQMNGTSLVSAVTLPNPGPTWKIVATGDFNGDGKTDLLWDNTVSGQPAIWEMNGNSIISAVGLTPQPANMQIVGTGDFNGDGDADILWINTSTNAPTIWIMNGTSVSSMTTLAAPPPSWRLVGTSDVNGDGKADLLWQNSDGTTTVWEMNGTTVAAAVAVGNPGVPWILNNNDPPLPGTAGMGTAHTSMPDAESGAFSPGAQGGGVSPYELAGNGTTVANSLHIGSG